MSGKAEKKRRRFLRQEFNEKYAGMIEDIAEANGQFLKPKPKWFPMWLWVRILSIFVKIK